MGVRAEDWHDFAVGDRVMTIDGYPGVITEVSDGPYPGTERYTIVLDGGMGGGDYDSGEITEKLGGRTARTAALDPKDIPPEIRREFNKGFAAGRRGSASGDALQRADQRGASQWWKLGWMAGDSYVPGDDQYQILQEIYEASGGDWSKSGVRTAARADLPLLEPDEAIAAGLNLASVDYPELSEILYERPDWVEVEPATPTMRLSKAAKLAAPIDPVWNKKKPDPIGDSLTDPAQPGWWRKIVGPALDRMNQALPPEHQVTDLNAMPGIQWCRFRREGYCYFPDHLDAQGTKEAGYAVWTPVNQGICPRRNHKAQKDCPVSEPGPDSGESVMYPDATISWSQGGQRKNRSYAMKHGAADVDAVMVELTRKARVGQQKHGMSAEADAQPWQIISIKDTREFIEQDDRFVPISGSGDMRPCDRCGRVHEIHATVRTASGEHYVVGIGCALAGHPELDAPLKAGKSAATTYAKNKADVERKRVFAARVAQEWTAVKAMPMPAHTEQDAAIIPNAKEWRTVDGRAYCVISAWADLKERMDCLESSWRDKVMDERMGGDRSWRQAVYQLDEAEMRLAKSEAKMKALGLQMEAKRYSDVPLVCDRCGSAAVTSIAGGKEGHTMLCPDCRDAPAEPHVAKATPKLSKWADLVVKARNIYRLGWVRVISVTPLKETNIPWHKGEEVGVVTAEVRGDNAIYLSSIIREPGSKRVGMWECSCPWASYSWARTRQWKKYEGRMCSHVLALMYEAQAQEMFSDFAGIQEDAEIPVWRDAEPTFYTPPDRVSYILTAQNLLGHLAAVKHPQVGALIEKARTSLHMAATVGMNHVGSFQNVKVKIRNQIINLLDIIDAGHAIVEEFGEVAVEEILYPTTGDLNQGLRYSGSKTAADDSSNGVMIALVPSIDMRAFIHTMGLGHDLDLEPPEGIHLTVAYLGKTDQIDRESFENIVRTTAQDFEPLIGKIGGAGVFANDDSNVLWVSADVPGLDLMRAALVSKILDAGIQLPADHGFTPHITVGYSDGPITVDTAELGEAGIHGAELAFSSLVAAYGGEWTHYSLHGSEAGVLAVEQPSNSEPKAAAVKPDIVVSGDTMTGSLVIEAKGTDPSESIEGFDRMSRCYELAGRYLMANDGTTMVHGTVDNGAKVIRHAWVVDPDGEIFEPTTGIHYDTASFEAQYHPAPRVTYPQDRAMVQMLRFKHWGPWDDEPSYTAMVEPEPESALAERSRTAAERREAVDSILYDEPQPALPVSYGSEEEDAALLEGLPPADPAGEEPLQPGDSRLAWVMGDYKGEAQDDDVAAAAEKFLDKQALKNFSPDEKAALIEEGGDMGASNLSSLDLSGTHYTWDENEDDSLMWAL